MVNEPVRDAAEQARDTAVRAARSKGARALARGGFVFVGILHLLIAFLAVQVAFGAHGEQADQSGAVSALAQAPGGVVILWAGAVCCAGLGVWWLSEALLSTRRADSKRDGAKDVAKNIGKAVVLLGLGGLFVSYALGVKSDSRQKYTELTATVLAAPGGQLLLYVVGVVLVGAGGYYVWRGLSQKFAEKEVRRTGTARGAVTVLGMIGYAAKGVALAVVGVLVLVATAKLDPSESTGLDGALRGLAAQPFGTWILCIVAAGLACFGLYSIARARYGEV